MSKALIGCLSLLFMTHVVEASQEAVHPWKKMYITADAGPFGEIVLSAETSGMPAVLSTLAVKVQGTLITVPREALNDVPGIVLNTAQVRTTKGGPELSIGFRVISLQPSASLLEEWVFFDIRGGKFRARRITTEEKIGQHVGDSPYGPINVIHTTSQKKEF